MNAETTNGENPGLTETWPWIPWVGPFALYMLLTTLEPSLSRYMAYQTLYAVKLIAVAGLIVRFWPRYRPVSFEGIRLATIAGTVGFAVWIVLVKAQAMIPGFNGMIESLLGKRTGFNPFPNELHSLAEMAFVGIRLLGLIVIVPIMEEVFWRGFLARFLIADDFRKVPVGRFSTFSFCFVTLAFVSVHPEILAALCWGAMINALCFRTGNLWACVGMHATTNAWLGAYILVTGNWSLW